MLMRDGMIPSIDAKEIARMVGDLAREIERDYGPDQELVMVCPLKGSVLFMADLCRRIDRPQIIDFVYITSPRGESCQMIKDLSVNVQDKHVLIIEEIIDAGRTLSFLKARIQASFPKSVKVVALLDKPARRELPLMPDYVGRTIEDRFVIGYGMDHGEIGRNYPDIYNFAQ